MAEQVQDRLPVERYSLCIVQVINRYLFEPLDFRSDSKDYHHPANSFLNQLLALCTSMSITLAVVYLELAWRINFAVAGVGFLGHFLIVRSVFTTDDFNNRDESHAFGGLIHGQEFLCLSCSLQKRLNLCLN